MMGGIDQRVNQATLSAGSDPQTLQQRFSQNRGLIDLLALQKLKSEKEAAAKEMAMQMQQHPQTIVEQREQEVMGMNKQELMNKMTPTMQRLGNESLPENQQQQTQPGPQPAQMGIAQAAPPQRFQRGGLVGFAAGGQPKTEEELRIEKLIAEALSMGASPEEINKLLKGNPAGTRYLAQVTGGDSVAEEDRLLPALETSGTSRVDYGPRVVGDAPSYKWGSHPNATPAYSEEDLTPITPQGKHKYLSPFYNKLAAAREKQTKEGPFDYGDSLTNILPYLVDPAGAKLADMFPKVTIGGKSPKEAIGSGITKLLEYGDNAGWRNPNPVPPGASMPTTNPSDPQADQLQPIFTTAKRVADANTPPAPAIPAIDAGNQALLDQILGVNPPPETPPATPGAPGPGVGGPGLGNTLMSENMQALTKEATAEAMRKPADLEAARRAQYKKDMSGLMGMAEQMAAKRMALEATMQQQANPRTLAYDRLAAMAANMGNSPYFGTSMGRGGAAAVNQRKAQERQARANDLALYEMLSKEADIQGKIGEGTFKAGTGGYDTAQTAKTAGMNSAMTAEISDLNAKVRRETNATLNALNIADKEARTNLAREKLLNDYIEAENELEASVPEMMAILPNSPLKEEWSDLKKKVENDIAKGTNGKVAERQRRMRAIEQQLFPEVFKSLEQIRTLRKLKQAELGIQLPEVGGMGGTSGFTYRGVK